MQNGNGVAEKGTFLVKAGLAQMSKGGLIMDVVNAEQAKIAEEAGACAVMALERVPADIRREGGVARMSDPRLIKEIMAAVTIFKYLDIVHENLLAFCRFLFGLGNNSCIR